MDLLPPRTKAAPQQPPAVRAAIESFLASCRQPALFEPGDEPLPLTPANFVLELRPAWVQLHAWSERGNLARRVVAARPPEPGRLALECQRFDGRAATLHLVDLAGARAARALTAGRRDALLALFRRQLARQFPDWRVAEATAGADLEHSLSPAFPRALLARGRSALAALCAPATSGDADRALTFGLIWLDYLRRRERRRAVEGLALFLPAGRHMTTCLRLPWLDERRVRVQLFAWDEHGSERIVDPADHGNLLCAIQPAADPRPAAAATPEAQLEAAVRARLEVIDPTLRTAPVYGQTPALAGRERSVLDLLAADRCGRLAVIELKATEELHLPVQGLDYWIQVTGHAAAQEFTRQGYFPGVALRAEAPRLLLIAPALQFHPTTETVLGFFSPRIEVERIGLALNWPRALRVVLRATGATRPGWDDLG